MSANRDRTNDDPFRDVTALEARPERAYDDQNASTLVLPNGTRLASFHRPFMTVCARLVIAQHREAA